MYTVEKTADGMTAAWSHDGLDPALWRGGDLTAPAYGQEQLLYALNEGQEEALELAREKCGFRPRADAARTRAGERGRQRMDGCARG